MIAFLYGTSHHRELGGNDPFEAKYHCSRNLRLRQVVNWHKKKKIWCLFGKLPVFAELVWLWFLLLFLFFWGGMSWFFLPFQSRWGVFPLLTPRAGFRHQIPWIFLFPPWTNVGSQQEIFLLLLSLLRFWFCNFFGNRDEEGGWEGARVCVEGWME